MRRLTLNELLERAMAYEHWRAPLDPTLRRAALASGGSIGLALLAVWFLPDLAGLADTPFMLVLGTFYGDMLDWLGRHRALLLGSIGVSACAYLLLLTLTGGFRAGQPGRHWATFGVVAIGALNGCVLAVMAAVVLVNLVLVLLLAGCILVLLAGIGRVLYHHRR